MRERAEAWRAWASPVHQPVGAAGAPEWGGGPRQATPSSRTDEPGQLSHSPFMTIQDRDGVIEDFY